MVWVDNTRILAIFAVVLIHVTAPIVIGVDSLNSVQWWVGNVYDASVRWCVPVFVMVSGALLLSDDKREAMCTFYKRRATKVFVPMLFWSFFFLAWNCFNRQAAGNPPSLLSFCKILLSGKPYFHMWFLYMLMGLYFTAPFIKIIIRNTSKNELNFFVLALFLMATVNCLYESLYDSKNLLFINWFLPYLPYFILGHIIITFKQEPNIKAALSIFVSSVILTAIGCFLGSESYGLEKGVYFYKYLSITVIPMSISIMFLLKRLRVPIILSKKVTKQIAGLALGIYLVHPLILELLIHYNVYARAYNAVISIPCISVLAFSISATVAWFIHQIPYLKRII